VLRVDNLARQTAFWTAALEYLRREEASDDFVLLRPRNGVGSNVARIGMTRRGNSLRVFMDRRPPMTLYNALAPSSPLAPIERAFRVERISWNIY
jgi:hypothetical protein